MPRNRWRLLILVGLLAAFAAAWWVRTPGYMDAEYYFATAKQLAIGQGFNEPFLWNYLNDPAGLPHASHQYWMPLVSLLAAAPMALFGQAFRAAQVPFLLLTATLPWLTSRLALSMGATSRQAWLAGLLAACSGFFLPFMLTTDSFSLYALLGTLALRTRRVLQWDVENMRVTNNRQANNFIDTPYRDGWEL